MSTNRFEVEAFMDELELKYFTKEESTDVSWVLLFGQSGGLLIVLTEEGEFLLFRSMSLLQFSSLTAEQAQRLPLELLKRNDSLKLGRYALDKDVVFEIGFPVENGELTKSQFRRLIGTCLSEVMLFQDRLPDMLSGNAEGDPIDDLMQRLIAGDHPNAA